MSSSEKIRPLLKDLRRIVGRDAVRSEPGELLVFESDGLTLYRGSPLAVVFPQAESEVARLCRYLHSRGVPFVARGSGTGLSGGAVANEAVVIETSRMSRILEIDAANRRARVQAGVPNAALGAAAAAVGLQYAPDPSSQVACTLGGNVAENSGGPHCLKYGVTMNHVWGLRVVLPDGEVLDLPGPEDSAYDLVGLFVGSEGTFGIAVEIELRLVPLPETAATLLAHFDDVSMASRAVSAIIARGIVPAALEMVDRETIRAVEASVYAAGFPTDVAASLIVELDGPRPGVEEDAARAEEILREHRAREVHRARDEGEREKFWQARKKAFGAMGRLAPDLLVQDATVPRSRLPAVLDRVYEIARQHGLTVTNVFHAGDGNLHPNIPFDRRDADQLARVQAASKEIMAACVAAGGTITGEHGVGIDKRRYMEMIYSQDDLACLRAVKAVWDPKGLCNPGKVLPDATQVAGADGGGSPAAASGAPTPSGGAGGVGAGRVGAERVARAVEAALGGGALLPPDEWPAIAGARVPTAAPGSLEALSACLHAASEQRARVLPVGAGTWLEAGGGFPPGGVDLVVSTRRLAGVRSFEPDDLVATVEAGVLVSSLGSAFAEGGECWPVDPLGGGTVGAVIATASAGPLATGYGGVRDHVLGLTAVRADGRVIRPGGRGGRVVKNVAGYDLTRLFTGSWGTLGIIAEAHLRLSPKPAADATAAIFADEPETLLRLAARLDSAPLLPSACEMLSPSAAGGLGVEANRWQMWVRWLGSEAAVAAAVEEARRWAAEAGAQAEVGASRSASWSRVTEVEDRMDARLALRWQGLPTALAAGLALTRAFLGGQTPAVLAAPTLGRMWVFVPRATWEAAPQRVWVDRVAGFQKEAERQRAWCVVERAPQEVTSAIDAWGDPGAAVRILRGVKAAFDPDHALAPGRFRWA